MRPIDVDRIRDPGREDRCREGERSVRSREIEGRARARVRLRAAPRSSSRDRPAASVSSVSGVGAKKPVPTDSRLVQRPERASAETRGLKNVPYSLWRSTRPLARQRQPRGERDVVLRKCARDVKAYRTAARRAARRRRVRRDAADPCVPSGCAAHRDFPERRVVLVALAHLAELMVVALPRDRGACGDHVSVRSPGTARPRRHRTGGSRALRRTAPRSSAARCRQACRRRGPRR